MSRHQPPPAAGCRPGFTLVELLVAMTITVILGMIVVMAYNTCMQAYYRTEKQLQALAAFRNTADRLEREVNSMVFKAGVYERPAVGYDCGPGNFFNLWWQTQIKYINADPVNPNPGVPILHSGGANLDWHTAPNGRSMYQINFRPRYLGYYSTGDGFTIDRTEIYYNPPEDKLVWNNGLDNDGDDPDGDAGLKILYGDRGCLMFRKTFDKDMCWAEWYSPAVMLAPRLGSKNLNRFRPNDYRDPYHGPYSRWNFPPSADEISGPLSAADLVASGDLAGTAADYKVPRSAAATQALKNTGYIVDTGTVIGEGFSDLRFYYLYKHQATDQFLYADWWPWDNDNNPTTPSTKDPNMPVHTVQVITAGTVTLRACNPAWCGNPVPKHVVYDTAKANAPIPNNFDITYFTLPLAVSVKFTFTIGRQQHVYEKLIFLHASRWLMYLNP